MPIGSPPPYEGKYANQVVDYTPELMAEDQCGTGRVYRFAEHELPDTTLAGSNDFAEVHSQSPLTPDELAAVLAKAEATYREAQKRQGLSADGVDGGPITIYVLDDQGFIEYSDDASGAIADQDEHGNYLVTSRSQALGSMEDPLFVHESVHLTDAEDDVTRLESAGVPYFLLEGKALAIEVGYAGETEEGIREYDWEKATAAAELTGDEAAMQMKYAREAEATQSSACFNQVYEAGGLFVEYLRTGFNGGEPNAVVLLAEAIDMVHKGSSFADAFQAKFGATLEGAEEAFVQYVRDTEGQPLERLKDTVFEKPYRFPPIATTALHILAAQTSDDMLSGLLAAQAAAEPGSDDEARIAGQIETIVRGKETAYREAYAWYDETYWEMLDQIEAQVEGGAGDVQTILNALDPYLTERARENAQVLQELRDWASYEAGEQLAAAS
jgi:hypothetical protein